MLTVINLLQATELLLQDLVFDLADYFLVVVQDLTWPDQEFIQSLVLKLNASQKHFKQVIVIHNFRDTEGVQDALDHWKVGRSSHPCSLFIYSVASSCELIPNGRADKQVYCTTYSHSNVYLS